LLVNSGFSFFVSLSFLFDFCVDFCLAVDFFGTFVMQLCEAGTQPTRGRQGRTI